jgi:hypothetical protein
MPLKVSGSLVQKQSKKRKTGARFFDFAELKAREETHYSFDFVEERQEKSFTHSFCVAISSVQSAVFLSVFLYPFPEVEQETMTEF